MGVWRDMPVEALEQQYSPSRWSPRLDSEAVIQAHLEATAAGTQRARAGAQTSLHVPYGDGDREKLDIYFPAEPAGAFPALVYIHGGYWQCLSKDESGFAAPPLVSQGVAVVAVGYDIAPKGHMDAMVLQVRRSLAFLVRRYSRIRWATRGPLRPTTVAVGGPSGQTVLLRHCVRRQSMDREMRRPSCRNWAAVLAAAPPPPRGAGCPWAGATPSPPALAHGSLSPEACTCVDTRPGPTWQPWCWPRTGRSMEWCRISKVAQLCPGCPYLGRGISAADGDKLPTGAGSAGLWAPGQAAPGVCVSCTHQQLTEAWGCGHKESSHAQGCKEEILYAEGGEPLVQVAQRVGRCPIPGNIPGQVGRGSEQPDPVEVVPAYGRGLD
ncbi:kynurenine formamidase isoform X1 [Rissa tridactyla]|uniref:kynurenine formamidase isoform X1 n=1 Tax=Rissa tridactyla TaxID=75485 RepID=UPI0023BAB98B|nr:kynurenine formamidase isoform X1 [Rissa tridactyla]